MSRQDGQDLSRLEHQIGRLLRLGVALSAASLGVGLLLSVAGYTVMAGRLLATGLVLMMAIPVTRILAACADALRRRDQLLILATVLVVVIMVATVAYSFLAPVS